MRNDTLWGAASALLPDVRSDQDITWSDQQLDEKLIGMTARGMAILNGLAGAEQDYVGDTLAKQLLIDYVRYMRAGAANEFLTNYGQEIRMLRMHQEVDSYAEESASDLS